MSYPFGAGMGGIHEHYENILCSIERIRFKDAILKGNESCSAGNSAVKRLNISSYMCRLSAPERKKGSKTH